MLYIFTYFMLSLSVLRKNVVNFCDAFNREGALQKLKRLNQKLNLKGKFVYHYVSWPF